MYVELKLLHLKRNDGHTFNHRESNEVPVFYRSNSTHVTVSLFYYCFSAKIVRTRGHRKESQIKFMFMEAENGTISV